MEQMEKKKKKKIDKKQKRKKMLYTNGPLHALPPHSTRASFMTLTFPPPFTEASHPFPHAPRPCKFFFSSFFFVCLSSRSVCSIFFLILSSYFFPLLFSFLLPFLSFLFPFISLLQLLFTPFLKKKSYCFSASRPILHSGSGAYLQREKDK